MLTVYEEASIYCGNPQPATPLAAQFSLSFGLAAMLRFGQLDAASYEPPRFLDAELRRLEALVEVRIDPDLTARRERGASVSVTANGQSLDEQVDSRDADLLLDTDGTIAKFVHNAAPSLDARSGGAFARALVDAVPDTQLRELWRLLAAVPAGSRITTNQGARHVR